MKNAQKCSLIAVKDRLPVATRPRTSSAVVLHPKIENKNCCCIIYYTFETFSFFWMEFAGSSEWPILSITHS